MNFDVFDPDYSAWFLSHKWKPIVSRATILTRPVDGGAPRMMCVQEKCSVCGIMAAKMETGRPEAMDFKSTLCGNVVARQVLDS